MKRLPVPTFLAFWLLNPAAAVAGMPVVTLTEVATVRVETISFFLIALLLSAGAIMLIWNKVRRDFPILPRLTYGGSLGLVILWGLLFVLVLTMISGARELMTPGAWKKQGATYQLANADDKSKSSEPANRTDEELKETRLKKMMELKTTLWKLGEKQGMKLPANRNEIGIADELWRMQPSGLRYVYVGGRDIGDGSKILAYEPDIFPSKSYVLLTNGEIERMSPEEISDALAKESK